MNEVYLAFYRGTAPGFAGLVDRGIRLVTRSRYSHVEVCVGHPFEIAAMCVSASGMDGGVRGKRMSLSPARWDVMPAPWINRGDVYRWLLDNQGAGYDWLGVLRFAFPVFRGSRRRWFCSEVVADLLGLQEPWRFSPADAHIIASRLQAE